MKLDPRIIEGKKPLTCFDAEEAEQFIGKECYFCDCALVFTNLDKFTTLVRDVLFRVQDTEKPFVTDTIGCFRYAYCLPCEWVQEQKRPQWRAFKDHAEYKEFLNDGIIESWVKIKDKGDGKIYELMYIGGGDDKICLGGMMLSVSNLFKDFELFNECAREWLPFGVEGEEEKGDGL